MSIYKSMDADAYIEQRLAQQQQWYDKKAVSAKAKFLRMKAASVVGAALVPVIVNVPLPDQTQSYIATALSLMVVIVVSLESVYHFGDQWKNYRSTEQFLSRERVLFLCGEGVYKGMAAEDATILLVDRCEAQIAAENSATLNVLSVAAQQPEGVQRTNRSTGAPKP
jgi:hypothetical protein